MCNIQFVCHANNQKSLVISFDKMFRKTLRYRLYPEPLVICDYESVGLEMSEEDKNLLYLYWTPNIHKVPFKHRFIAGSSKCATKDLSCLLTKVSITTKDGLIRYCNTKTSHNTPQACCQPWTNWISVQQHPDI